VDEGTSDQAEKSSDSSGGVSDASNRSERGDLTSTTDSSGGPSKDQNDPSNNESSAAAEHSAITEFIVSHAVEHGLVEGAAHLAGIAAEGAIGIAGLVAGLDGSHDGQVPDESWTLPETTIEGTPTVDVHDLRDAPPEASGPDAPPEANQSEAPPEANQSVAPPEANQSR